MRISTPQELGALMGWDFAPSPEQWEAIRAPLEPAVVIAGAGSGTRPAASSASRTLARSWLAALVVNVRPST